MASEKSQLIQAFIKSIGEDIALYKNLSPLLQKQKELYITFDALQLNENIDAQKPLLEKLSDNVILKRQILSKLGLTSEQQSIEKLFNALPYSLATKVRNQWQTLQLLVEECQLLNRDNGASSAAFQELIINLREPAQHTYTESI